MNVIVVVLNYSYSTAQMQLYTHMCVLVSLHACVNMLPVTCDGVLMSLTYYTCVLHEGLHTRMCYSSGYKLATRVYVCTCNASINVHTFYKTLYT